MGRDRFLPRRDGTRNNVSSRQETRRDCYQEGCRSRPNRENSDYWDAVRDIMRLLVFQNLETRRDETRILVSSSREIRRDCKVLRPLGANIRAKIAKIGQFLVFTALHMVFGTEIRKFQICTICQMGRDRNIAGRDETETRLSETRQIGDFWPLKP